mgnify:CR=1 FL=1
MIQLAAGLRVQIRAELCKGLHILVLCQLDTQVGVGLLHGLGLGSAAHTGHRQTHIDGRAVACIEQGALEEDLTIGDGNDVGGDVAETSPACVSTMGSAVMEPPPRSSRIRQERSSRRECR